MRMEGELPKEEYLSHREKISANIMKLEREIDTIRNEGLINRTTSKKKLSSQELFAMLETELDFSKPVIKEGFIDSFVERVTPRTSLEFDWYINLLPHTDNIKEYRELMSFKIEYEDAHSYREKCGAILRKNQYKEVVVHVYA